MEISPNEIGVHENYELAIPAGYEYDGYYIIQTGNNCLLSAQKRSDENRLRVTMLNTNDSAGTYVYAINVRYRLTM